MRAPKRAEKEPDFTSCRSSDKNTFFNGSVRAFKVNMLEDKDGYRTIPDATGAGTWVDH